MSRTAVAQPPEPTSLQPMNAAQVDLSPTAKIEMSPAAAALSPTKRAAGLSPVTLAQLISPHMAPESEVEEEFSANHRLLEVIIGGVPNCSYYKAIWKPGAYTYHLLPPNFLNLPHMLTGLAAPKQLVGMAMVAASRAAHCPYCTAHCASFAQRRGANPTLAAGRAGDKPVEKAVENFATALASVPHTFTSTHQQNLRAHLSSDNTEWIAMAVCMMGYLAKFMDGLGVELELQAVNDVKKVLGPDEWQPGQHEWRAKLDNSTLDPEQGVPVPKADGLPEALKILWNAPKGLKKEARMLEGVPKSASAARAMIKGYGFDEPLLESLSFARVRRALAGMLHYNLAPHHTVLGVPKKALSGIVFAKRLGNRELAERLKSLATHHSVSEELIQLADMAPETFNPQECKQVDEKLLAAFMMADTMSTSPAHVDAATIGQAAALQASEVVEVTVFFSILQLLHRLAVWKACV